MDKVANPTADNVLITDASGQAIDSGVPIGDVVTTDDLATETTPGVMKLNPAQSIDLNEDGQAFVREFLKKKRDAGTTLVVATHSRELAGDLADVRIQMNRNHRIVDIRENRA